MDALKSLGINPIYLLSYVANFFVLAALLRIFLYRPILGIFEQRRAKIAKGLEDARAAETARANAETDRQHLLDDARTEAQKLRAEALEQAEQAGNKIKADALVEADRIKANAMAALDIEREKMLCEMREQIAAIAIAVANRLIGESLDRARHETLIDEFFAKLPSGMTVELTGADGDMAEVTSAVLLTPEEQARIKSSLGVGEVTFRVDPKILGGLRVRVGDKVADGSVAGQLETLRLSLS